MPVPKKKKKDISITETPSLSAEFLPVEKQARSVEEIQNILFNTISHEELQRGIDKYNKEHEIEHKEVFRDLNIIKSFLMEYLDSFMLLGYDVHGEKIIIRQCRTAKDKDSMNEFLKSAFLHQQQSSFMD